MFIIKSSEWHQAMNGIKNPIDFCVVLPDNWRTFDLFQSSVVALAKSQDHRVIYGVFCIWRLCNAVRQWLHLGYPVTRANYSRGGGLRIEPSGLGASSRSLFDAMR